jgi:hypothetical protein
MLQCSPTIPDTDSIRNVPRWTQEEDKLLLSLVNRFGTKDWCMIALGALNNRTPRQCRERYKNHVKPSLRSGNAQLKAPRVFQSSC